MNDIARPFLNKPEIEMHDYQRDHFTFPRQTHLPRSAFDRQSTGDYYVGVICTVIAVTLLILGFAGVLQ